MLQGPRGAKIWPEPGDLRENSRHGRTWREGEGKGGGSGKVWASSPQNQSNHLMSAYLVPGPGLGLEEESSFVIKNSFGWVCPFSFQLGENLPHVATGGQGQRGRPRASA